MTHFDLKDFRITAAHLNETFCQGAYAIGKIRRFQFFAFYAERLPLDVQRSLDGYRLIFLSLRPDDRSEATYVWDGGLKRRTNDADELAALKGFLDGMRDVFDTRHDLLSDDPFPYFCEPVPPAIFSPGSVVATPAVLAAVDAAGLLPETFLDRHVSGDWGDIGTGDWLANDAALRDESRVVSVYHLPGGTKLYVITEADRSSTCVMLAEEY